MHILGYEVVLGHIIIFSAILLSFAFVVMFLASIARTLQDVLIATTVSAGHSKLSNEAAVGNGEKLQATTAKLIGAIDRSKEELTIKVADAAHATRPVIPEELRVVIAHEAEKPL